MTMPAARIRRLTLTEFRSYHAAQIDVGAGPVVLVGPNGAGKTNLIEAISFLAPGRGLRRATLEDVAFSEGDGSWAVSAEVEGALGLATLAPASSRRSARTRAFAQMPHRSRAGRVRRRLRGSPARRLAGAGDGRAVQRPGLRAASLPRSARAGGRRRAHDARQCARAIAALAQPAAGGCASRSALARRGRARDRRAGGGGHGVAGGGGRPSAGDAGRPQRSGLAVSGGRDRARRLDGAARCRSIRRPRSRTVIVRCSGTTAPATPPPAARSTART